MLQDAICVHHGGYHGPDESERGKRGDVSVEGESEPNGITENRFCASCQRECKQSAMCLVVMCPRYVAAPRQQKLPVRFGKLRKSV